MLAIIQARLNSERFPGKVLADLHGQPVLKHVIDRVSSAAMVSRVVVATCATDGDTIQGHCKEWDAETASYDGEDADVLGRLRWISDIYAARWSIRVCGDNPLVDPRGIDELCIAAKNNPTVDYVGYRDPDGQPTIKRPTGWFAEVVKVSALRRADFEVPPDDPHREHVTSWMYEHPERYPCYWVDLPEWYTPDLPNVAIDTEEDLERVAEFMSGKGDDAATD